MENTPLALAGAPAAGSLDRAPLKAWTMDKSRSSSGETLKDHRSVADILLRTGSDTPLPSSFTLRVKPDRRRAQLPIPGGRDRRRPR